jgi:DNA-binding transcriptional regulator YhcF (GntR family)
MIHGKEELTIEEGQFVTGRFTIATDLKANPNTIYKRLDSLRRLQFLNIKSNNKFSVITIVNWELYQGNGDESNNKSNNKVTTKEQQSNTNKNVKNVINNKQKEYSAFFDEVWKLYPVKKGKAQIKDKQKQVLFDVGIDVITKCIDRYISNKPEWQAFQNGSTFFNSGYVDYLDANYEEPKGYGYMLPGGGAML